MNAMRSSRALPFLAVFAMASLDAQAQNLPWPTDPPPAGAPVAAPAPMMAPPAMSPAMAPPPMQAGPPGGGPPCLQEFTKLRTETEKRGAEAKVGQERKISREEMCKLIQTYAAAEGKWVKYAKDNITTSCGIPPQVAEQLAGVHARTLMIRKQVCATGPAAGGPPPPPAAPSLSDALGTTQLPVPEGTKKSGPGTFDTLTGNAITR